MHRPNDERSDDLQRETYRMASVMTDEMLPSTCPMSLIKRMRKFSFNSERTSVRSIARMRRLTRFLGIERILRLILGIVGRNRECTEDGRSLHLIDAG